MTKTASTLAQILFSLACLMLVAPVFADGVSIEHASGRKKDAVYLMDAKIRYDLGTSVLEALTHGIPLHFDVTIELRRERNWVWDAPVKTFTLGYILQYQPLSNDYLVTDINRGNVETLKELKDALNYLGTITNFPIFNDTEVDAGRTYNCIIMAALKTSTLPLPLQPLAYISPTWHLTSQWYEWTIR